MKKERHKWGGLVTLLPDSRKARLPVTWGYKQTGLLYAVQ